MAGYNIQSLYATVSSVVSNTTEAIITNIRDSLNNLPVNTNTEALPVTPSPSMDARDLRKVQIPQTKVGLGSMEGDLITMMKKYLEVVGLVFFVWLLGYFHFSVSWILLAVFIYLFRQRQRAQFKLRHHMLSEINKNEEQYIKARLDELPSWVFFPDVERAEWVNRIIKQAWPYANKYIDQAIFRDIMIPLIRGTSPALSDFAFERLDLGETPPRIGGIKVYTENVRDQIMMDVEVFYAGDAHVKAKIKGIVCGIKDIQFVGDVRIILSPLINTIPLFGALTYFFLKKPSIHFKLTDAGTLVDIPGLNDLMLVQINDIVASLMVLPNRQVFPLVNDISIGHLRWSNPQGVVRVFIIKAHDLIKADINLLGKGKSDPFVRVKAQGSAEYKTKTINNTTEPAWNEVFEFVVEHYETDFIQFEVFDEDPGADDFIGRAQFPLDALVDKEAVDTWLTLKDVKKGSLNVCLQYFGLTTQKSSLAIMEKTNSQMMRREKLSKALLVCYIDRCINLPRSKKTRREPNPFCRIKLEGNEVKTAAFESQTNPRFEHVSQLLCGSPLHEKLRIDVCDSRSNNDVIAYFEIPLKKIYDTETMTIDTQSFPLKSLSEPLDQAFILLRLSLFILSPGRSNETRINPLPPQSPSSGSIHSFDSLPSSTTDVKSNIVLEDNKGTKSIASALPLHPSSPSLRSKSEHRSTTDKSIIISDDPDLQTTKYGRIKLGIRYTVQRKSLSVTVYSCKDLINVHEQNLPDPYIRLYLLPDFKKDKKKTKSIHDQIHPNYDELFEWGGSLADIRRQRLSLSIKNNSPLFAQEETYMGDLQIDLSNIDPEKTSVAWYALQEPNTSGGGVIKIKYDTLESNEHSTQF
ncbi:unnamed protein product [Adineta steineri]|uniref:Uncharacterized protein n=1 Tax=Adineta steineri TaxID=433720 RepID=A0A815DB14_9BILA|nr:unnamed protein product [Adineta steineri]CAF1299152.1 unnamed protein product [Adineta steineri]